MPMWVKLLIEVILYVLQSIRQQGLQKTHEVLKTECEKCSVKAKDNQ